MKTTRFYLSAAIFCMILLFSILNTAQADEDDLGLAALGPDSVQIRWLAANYPDADSLKLYRGTGGQQGQLITTLYKQQDTHVLYTDTGLETGTVYNYTGHLYDGDVLLPITLTDSAVPLMLPEIASFSFARSGDWFTLSVSWTPVAFATTYDCSLMRDGTHVAYGGYDGSVSRIVTAPVYNGPAAYSWFVRGYVNGVRGPVSVLNLASFSSPSDIPETPQGTGSPVLSASPAGDYTVKLSWNEISGADSYTVYGGLTHSVMSPLAELTGQTSCVVTMGQEALFVFLAVAWDNGVPAYSNIASSMAAPLPDVTVKLHPDKQEGFLYAELIFHNAIYLDKHRVRYGKADSTLLIVTYPEGISTVLQFPLPATKTEYVFHVTKRYTPGNGTMFYGPTVQIKAVYSPILFLFPGGSLVWEVINPWPEPWNLPWILELMTAFAYPAGDVSGPEIGVSALADYAGKLAARKDTAGQEYRMFDLFLPDFAGLLRAAYQYPPDIETADLAAQQLRKVSFLLAGRKPEELGDQEALRYKNLIRGIRDLFGPAATAAPTRYVRPTPAPTRIFRTSIPFPLITPSPTPVIPR